MIRITYILLAVLCCQLTLAQNEEDSTIDEAYREDQFYFSTTYNLLNNMSDEMAQNGFSSGFHFGLIRDMPINEKRSFAIGIGLGYSVNSINQNLGITENNQGVLDYSIISSGSFTKNKITLHVVEIPLEFRWRASTPENYSFWRIYSGFKFGYVFASSAKFVGDPNNIKIKGIDDINKLQYGFTLSVGYDKINAHLYYSLSKLFEDSAKINGQQIEVALIKIGLIIYIL